MEGEKVEMLQALKKQLAIDLGCESSDFDRSKNIVNIMQSNSCKQFRKRRNLENGLLIFMACFGKGTAAAADSCLADFMAGYIKTMEGFRCFDMPLDTLANELKKHGGIISEIEEFYLPGDGKISDITPGFDIEILEGAAIEKLYTDQRFHMALGYTREADRKDMLALAAYLDGELSGVAGASNDTDDIWQVGIDVVPEKRGRHIAATLVRVITNEVLKNGKIPYYGTAWSNIASKRVAIAAGYKPAWVELKARKKA